MATRYSENIWRIQSLGLRYLRKGPDADLGANEDVVDGDVNQFNEESQEAQHNEANPQRDDHALQLCKKQVEMNKARCTLWH